MDSLYLVRNGVPFDVAFSLPADERLAWVAIMGRLATGRTFDWSTQTWSDQA